jgi:hypothetical protein
MPLTTSDNLWSYKKTRDERYLTNHVVIGPQRTPLLRGSYDGLRYSRLDYSQYCRLPASIQPGISVEKALRSIGHRTTIDPAIVVAASVSTTVQYVEHLKQDGILQPQVNDGIIGWASNDYLGGSTAASSFEKRSKSECDNPTSARVKVRPMPCLQTQFGRNAPRSD